MGGGHRTRSCLSTALLFQLKEWWADSSPHLCAPFLRPKGRPQPEDSNLRRSVDQFVKPTVLGPTFSAPTPAHTHTQTHTQPAPWCTCTSTRGAQTQQSVRWMVSTRVIPMHVVSPLEIGTPIVCQFVDTDFQADIYMQRIASIVTWSKEFPF